MYHWLWHVIIYLFIIDHGGRSPIPCSHHPYDGPLVTSSARDPLKGVTDGSRTPELDSQPCLTGLHSVLSTTIVVDKKANSTSRHPFNLRQQRLPFPRRAVILPRAYLTQINRRNLTAGRAKWQCSSYCRQHPVINHHHILFAADAESLLSFWRHNYFVIEHLMEKDITITCEDYHANILRSNNNNTPANNDGTVDNQKNELCLVISILISFHQDSLATTNRWKQTPIHSLFESKCTERAGEKGLGETLLGIWKCTKIYFIPKRSTTRHGIHRIPM